MYTELKNLISLIIDYRGKTPLKLGSDWSSSGYRALSAKNIKTGKIVNEESIRYVDENLYKKWMKNEILRGDIFITSEAPFGEVYYWNSDEKIVLSQRLFAIRPIKSINSQYLYFYMATEKFHKELESRATGSTVTGLRQPELLKCKINVKPIEEQQHIVNILGSLDDKIENNEKILKLLDKALLIIYKKDLSKKLKTNNSYKLIRLSDVAYFQNGYSYKGKDLTETSKVALMTIKNFDRNVGFKIDGFKNLNPQNDSKQSQIVELYDTVVAHTDLTQNAEIIGNAEMLLNKSKYDKIIASMDLVIVKPKKINKFLLYLFLHNEDFKCHALGYTAGTTVLHLNKKALQEYKICFPVDNKKLIKLENQIELLILKQASIIEINLKLNELKQLYLKKFFG